MKTTRTSITTVLLALASMSVAATFARADSYSWANLQSDIPGVAAHVDPNLVNPWGMAANSTGTTIWVSDNGTGVSTLYGQDGTARSLIVTIPPASKNKGGGNPTGIAFNGTAFFKVTKNGNSQPARFIFASEDGSISGWNPNVDGTNAIIAVDNSKNKAVYKGATLGTATGHNFLYVTNFFSGHVETYDENFQQTNPNGFADPNLPAGYAPFGIQNISGQIYVTYALQDKKKHDDVHGPGNGFVNVFDTSGNLVRRLVSNGNLNSPWGLALVGGDELWVGNFGDGKINNYNPTTGAFLGTINRADGTPLQFEGLWALLPLGDGVYFTAGIADESHGLFGLITED
ncbi:MAG TPA: TIGR03118 family protein [Chthoniobacterales bacterium]|nr:TIGR03118 family protein [Chthoniobacterales bacterium]